jgi:4a-hydroxytetrahydrobiopterin dehydratase
MASTLAEEHCVRVTRASKRVTDAEREGLSAQVPDWGVVTRDGIERLERVFRFKDFAGALDFTNRVAALAEAEDHHPAILTEWGRVTIGWWTHVVGGLHRNDFVMAAQTDRVQPPAMS